MDALKHARHIVRRYAEGGSDDEEAPSPPPLHGPLGIGNPVHSLTTQAPVLQIDPLQSPRGTAGAPHIEEPTPAPQSREDLAGQVAGQLVERYGDNHQAISERMLNLDPADHNNVLAALPPSVRNGVIDHRWNEASRALGVQQGPTPKPEPPTVSRSYNFWNDYNAALLRSNSATERGFYDNMNQIGSWLNGGVSINDIRNLHDNDLEGVMDYFELRPAASRRWPSLHEAADAEDSLRAAAREGTASDDRLTANDPRAELEKKAFEAGTPPAGLRQPGASRTGYVSPYGIYGQSQLSDKEYEALSNPEQLSRYEGENTSNYVAREIHPFGDVTRDALDAFNKYVRPTAGSITKFAKQFFAGYDTREINVEGGLHPEYGEGTVSFDGRLTDKGNHVADTSVSINPATNSAHLGLIEIAGPYRGVAGPKLLRNQIDTYKQMKLDYVDLYAAGGGDPYGGSYAWAKYGFVPNQKDWDLMRTRFMQRLDNPQYARYLAPTDPEQMQILKNILSTKGPRAIWPLSDFTAPAATGQPSGKMLLLGTGWSGQLTFNDPGAMRRFDAYIARPKKPKP